MGNTPATESAASSASHSGPWRCTTGTRAVRSTAMITSGMLVCEKNAPFVASLSIPVSVSRPADPTSGDLNSWATFSGLNVLEAVVDSAAL